MKHTPRAVGRPREFDEDEALERAMDAFWRKGYEATSLSDLVACTGLHKGSLYQAFGSKHELFMKALEHYAQDEYRHLAQVADDGASPLQQLRALVHNFCEHNSGRHGCLMLNTLVELAPHDADVKQFLDTARRRREQLIATLIRRAQLIGELATTRTPNRLARQLMIAMAGAAATGKGLFPKRVATETLNDVIDSWR